MTVDASSDQTWIKARNLLKWYVQMGVTETTAFSSSSKLKEPSPTTSETSEAFSPVSPVWLPGPPLPSAGAESPSPKLSQKLERPEQVSLTLQDRVAQARSLEELKEIMETFEGCALKQTATHTVFGVGNPKARVMLIGEAPGAEEDLKGEPFVGRSGKLLDLMFESIGLSRATNLYITNMIPWRPPGNRQPTTAETIICLPFVRRHIELVHPEYLIFVGGVAAKALAHTSEGIVRLRGKWMAYTSPGLRSPLKAMAIYHPAYLLRSLGQKRKAWQDLLTLFLDLSGHDSSL